MHSAIKKALMLAQNRRQYQTGGVPDDASQEAFLQEQLQGSAPQYDPQGGLDTAKTAAQSLAGMTTPGAIADAAGYLGGPSALQNLRDQNYFDAALQLAAVVPGVGPLSKAAKIAKAAKEGEAVAEAERILKGFQTAKGSVYEVTPEGYTIRNKAPRPEHPGEQGLQPPSKRTIYMTPEEMNKLSDIQAKSPYQRGLVYNDPTNHVGMMYYTGPSAGKIEKRTVAKFSTTPEIGLHPVENFGREKTIHFGNPITELYHSDNWPPANNPSFSIETASPDLKVNRRYKTVKQASKSLPRGAKLVHTMIEDPPVIPPPIKRDKGGSIDDHLTGRVELGQPDEASQEAFLQEQLQGSAPQYTPEEGMLTGKRAGLMAAGFAPGAGIATAAGQFPTAEGGKEPSMAEDWRKGEYLSAGLKGLGAAGDIAYGVPLVGPAVGAAMKAPLVAKLAMSVAPMAKLVGEVAPAVENVAESVVPQLTKGQSQELMRQNWASGNGNPEYRSWWHQWNIEEGPKYAAQKTQAVQQNPAANVPAEQFQIDPYDRVVNEIGMYSHGAEVARHMKQQKGTPQQMIAALRSAGVKPEEIRWSGVERVFADRPFVTGEELASHFEQNLPRVSRIEKIENSDFDYGRYDELFEEEYNSLNDEEYESLMRDALAEHDLDELPEHQRERLEEEAQERVSETIANIASERAHERLQSEQRENAPKWGSDEYNFPGGGNYQERILRFQHVNTGNYHPDIMDPATKSELKELDRLASEARANFRHEETIKNNQLNNFRYENAKDFANREIKEMKEAGHTFADPAVVEELQGKYFDLSDKFSQIARKRQNAFVNSSPELPKLEEEYNSLETLYRNAYEEYIQARQATEEKYFDDLVSKITNGFFSDEELARFVGKEKELEAINFSNQELQKAKELMLSSRKKLEDFENELERRSRELWVNVPEYEKGLYQHQTHLGDIENPFWHGRFKDYFINNPQTGERLKVLNKSEGQSDYAKEEFIRNLKPEEQSELEKLLNNTNRTPEENLRLSQYLSQTSGKIHEAPYVGNVDKWAEVSAKDTLAHAIENGYDRIFITGGEEQAKRWSGTMRKNIDFVQWINAEDVASGKNPETFLEPYSLAVYGKPFNKLAYNQQNELDTLINRISLGSEENVFPEDVYKIPRDGKKVNITATNGDNYRLVVKGVKQPNGSVKAVVVDSNLPGANGQTLSSLLGSEMSNRIIKDDSGHQDMAGYMMGAAGYEDVYNKAYPKAYKKIMKALDPNAKVETGTLPTPKTTESIYSFQIRDLFSKIPLEEQEKLKNEYEQVLDFVGDISSVRQMNTALRNFASPELRKYLEPLLSDERKGVWVHITPEMREKYKQIKRDYGAVFSAYRRGGAVKPRNSSHLNPIIKRGMDAVRRVKSQNGGLRTIIRRKDHEPVRGIKFHYPNEVSSDQPDIQDYQMKRHAHEFIGSPEPEVPQRGVYVDAPLFGGRNKLFSMSYYYQPLVEKALNLIYGQKTTPFYYIPETAPIARAVDAYETAKFVQRDPSSWKNYLGVPGTLMGLNKFGAPAVVAGAVAARDPEKIEQKEPEKLGPFDYGTTPEIISHQKGEPEIMQQAKPPEYAKGGEIHDDFESLMAEVDELLEKFKD